MFKKILVILLLLNINPVLFNGYHQSTTIQIEGIEEECYGTLLSRYSVSGSYSYNGHDDLGVPKDIEDKFKEYKDSDNYFYINFLQDVSGGLLYWFSYPPEEFKLLLYFPNEDRFVVSDEIYKRFALNTPYKAIFDGKSIKLVDNYNYMKLGMMTIGRIIICSLISILLISFTNKLYREDRKYVYLTNIVFQLMLHIFISLYSYKFGFTISEYIAFIWVPYIIFSIVQGYIFSKKTKGIKEPYVSSVLGSIAAYAIGLILADVAQVLYTIAYL